MKKEVATAIEEIRLAFSGKELVIAEDSEGGARVIVEEIELGPPFQQPQSWFGFYITCSYPYADVYPHFVRADLSLVSGHPLGEGTSAGQNFLGRAAIQLSRRSNRLNPKTDTAALKLLKVIEWLRRKA
jgi:hypothetical protein